MTHRPRCDYPNRSFLGKGSVEGRWGGTARANELALTGTRSKASDLLFILRGKSVQDRFIEPSRLDRPPSEPAKATAWSAHVFAARRGHDAIVFIRASFLPQRRPCPSVLNQFSLGRQVQKAYWSRPKCPERKATAEYPAVRGSCLPHC